MIIVFALRLCAALVLVILLYNFTVVLMVSIVKNDEETEDEDYRNGPSIVPVGAS